MKSAPKSKNPPPAGKEIYKLAEAAKKQAIKQNTAELKDKIKSSIAPTLGYVTTYASFMIILLLDGINHRGTSRCNRDFFLFLLINALGFGWFMTRKVWGWKGKI